MKLKSIFIFAMVAIMAMAGSAFAIDTVTTSSGADAGGTLFGHAIPGVVIGSNTGNVTLFTPSDTMGGVGTGYNTGNSGTGFVGGMPQLVSYAGTQYTGGVGPTSGYIMNSTLFGMCGGSTDNSANCSKFIPTKDNGGPTAFSFTNDANYIAATGGDGTQAFSTEPPGTQNFNQGTFLTGLVSGVGAGGGAGNPLVLNVLSQKT